MNIKKIHRWDISISEATSIQKELSMQVELNDSFDNVSVIAGIDMAYSKKTNTAFASVVFLSYPGLSVLKVVNEMDSIHMPYVPGYLSFREAPVILKALAKSDIEPDLIFIDGQGIAHPRGLGLASHIGMFIDKPVIGVAKSLLVGEFKEPQKNKGAFVPLLYKDRIVGSILRSRDNVKPIYISPGNKISIESSREWGLKLCTKYRIPEPTRLADKLVARYKKEMLDEN